MIRNRNLHNLPSSKRTIHYSANCVAFFCNVKTISNYTNPNRPSFQVPGLILEQSGKDWNQTKQNQTSFFVV